MPHPRTATTEQRHFDVDELDSLMSTLRKECNSLQLKNALATLASILREIPGLRTSQKILRNSILSVEEGLEAKLITKKDAQRDLNNAVDEFEEGYKEIVKELSQDKPAIDESLYEALDSGALRSYDSSKDVLQKAIQKSGIFVGYVPVLAISAPPLSAQKLVRAGIPAASYAGYTILKKQFIAGITNDYTHAHTRKGKKPSEENSPQKILDEFREVIQAKYGHLRLQEIAQTFSWWGCTWLWLASPKEVAIWKACTINATTVNSFKINKWSFPFGS